MTLIAQITDLHIRPQGVACYRVSETNLLADRAVRALKALDPAPDAVVVTGDLTERNDPREYRLVRRLLKRLSCPVYVMPGNHDRTDAMREHLSDFPLISKGSKEKVYYAAEVGELRLIALDSSIPGFANGELGKEQLDWLDTELAQHPRPTMIAVHHPPKAVGIRHMDDIALSDGAAFGKVISKYRHVERVICGHVHRPIISAFAGTVMTLCPGTAHQVVLDLNDSAPAEFVMEPPAYFLHHFTQEAGMVTHLAYVEAYPGPFPFWADEGVSWP
ncbi:phosphodiesterase [Stappia sp. F7233]|uniref:Phosphodiesterase n=1 Tax=Stappia albiluteola TaxID=2758565 RepID=A0A839AA34_9HYPH|nr:phosphodiesterase [Stappia albiluteola]MBA5776423.1 phosphodiesterase [Stappia albiluteola]